jgi:hypothetical protein
LAFVCMHFGTVAMPSDLRHLFLRFFRTGGAACDVPRRTSGSALPGYARRSLATGQGVVVFAWRRAFATVARVWQGAGRQ